MSELPGWLPPLVLFTDYHGDWPCYLAALYEVFTADFLGKQPDFRGKRMGLKRHPVIQGKEATFWHFIQEGPVEGGTELLIFAGVREFGGSDPLWNTKTTQRSRFGLRSEVIA